MSSPGPTIWVGHSFGGGRLVRAARSVACVDHLLLLDPVPIRGWGILDTKSFVLPPSVQSAACYRRRRCWGVPPYSHPIRGADCPFTNRRLGLGHDGIVGKTLVRRHLRRTIRCLADGG